MVWAVQGYPVQLAPMAAAEAELVAPAVLTPAEEEEAAAATTAAAAAALAKRPRTAQPAAAAVRLGRLPRRSP